MKKLIAIIVALMVAVWGITAIVDVPIPKYSKVFKLTPGEKIVINIVNADGEVTYTYEYPVVSSTKDWGYPYDISISTAQLFIIIHGSILK